jgi:hypothetical protein
MESPSRRRSDRVSLTLLLEASGKDNNGQEFKDAAKTLMISRHGAVLVLERELSPDQRIHVRRQSPAESQREGDVRVLNQFGKQRDGYLYAVEIVDDRVDLWGIAFPAAGDSGEAMARMLLECSYCHNREVMHLNGMELRAFETNRGVAHHCRNCGVPSIWTQALQEEDGKKPGGRGSRAKRAHAEAAAEIVPEQEQRERQRMRLKTRLTACIRQTGTDDERAVCEDISPIGMCFRSKRRYEANAPVDVAVPYSPDAANIFLPARIVYSEEMPKAGLFRHGTEYRRVGPRGG